MNETTKAGDAVLSDRVSLDNMSSVRSQELRCEHQRFVSLLHAFRGAQGSMKEQKRFAFMAGFDCRNTAMLRHCRRINLSQARQQLVYDASNGDTQGPADSQSDSRTERVPDSRSVGDALFQPFDIFKVHFSGRRRQWCAC